MRPKKAISLFIIALFLVGIVVIGIYVRNHGFSAREQPSWYEKILARNARKLATPADAKGMKDPNPFTEDRLAEARQDFVDDCALCHGLDGRGKDTIGRRMYPQVPDLASTGTQELADGELFYIINNGVRFTGMPAFGGEDDPDAFWGLVTFIRRLPQLSDTELKQMQDLTSHSGKGESEEVKGPDTKPNK